MGYAWDSLFQCIARLTECNMVLMNFSVSQIKKTYGNMLEQTKNNIRIQKIKIYDIFHFIFVNN